MKPHTKQVTVEPWGTVTLHFHSKLAKWLGGERNCATPDADNILIAGDVIYQRTLAHEFGHRERAKRLGWQYKPQIAWRFLLALDWKHPLKGGLNAWLQDGYAKSKAEAEADQFMRANYM